MAFEGGRGHHLGLGHADLGPVDGTAEAGIRHKQSGQCLDRAIPNGGGIGVEGTLLDALLVDVAAAITASRTLGGAVEWAQPASAAFEDVEFEGAAAARAAAIPVTLWFTVAGSPLA
ncbi:MAG: hypothetical protein WCP77_21990 [Roseococcus sp.]